MKWMLLFVFVLLAGSVYAEVSTVSSGVFRGSLRHIVTISAEDVVDNVASGDYLSFRFPGGQYLTASDTEELNVYVRRYDFTQETMIFDAGNQRFQEIKVGEEQALDVNGDGVDDVVLSFESLDRRGTFIVRDSTVVPAPPELVPENLSAEPCTVACTVDEDCEETCALPGTCAAFCVPPVPEPTTVEPASEDSGETFVESEKGWFTRFLEWLARLV